MKVWRVENNDLRGPYNPALTWRTATEAEFELSSEMGFAHTDDYHQGPYRAFGENYYGTKGQKFAFDSLPALRKWFRGYLTRLKANGFKVVELDSATGDITVTRIHDQTGAGQVMFIDHRPETTRPERRLTFQSL